VKISGTNTLALAPAEAYRRMQDPTVLAACMPGCESLEKIGEDEYRMKMKLAMASLSGAFDGKVRITDQHPPDSFRLIVEGTGKLGFMKGEGLLKFSPSGEAAEVSYEGDVQVIDATAKMMIKRFFEKLAS
jgi:carbon monoxide dehydrogenase subunit G